MILTFDTATAYVFVAILLLSIVIYAILIQPVAKLLPFAAQAAVQAWVSSLVQSAFKVLVSKGLDIEVKGDTIDSKESALVVVNHSSIIDYPLLTTLASDSGIGNNCFFFTHRRLLKLPTLAVLWSVWRGNGNWTAPSHTLSDIFRDVPRHGPRDAAKWIVLFPEVHELNPYSQREHQLLCSAAGAPLLKHLLYPRYPAFVQAVDHFQQSNVTTIYDLTVQYQSATKPLRTEVPSFSDFITSRKNWKVSIIVRKRPLSEVGSRPKAIQKWLETTWYRKDDLLERRKRKAK